MPNEKSVELARRAQAIYDERYREHLEATHADEFVAIEPDSGEFFLGATLSEAIQAARAAHPHQIPFAVRVGHQATVELGVLVS
jgi:hypothetical protein